MSSRLIAKVILINTARCTQQRGSKEPGETHITLFLYTIWYLFHLNNYSIIRDAISHSELYCGTYLYTEMNV